MRNPTYLFKIFLIFLIIFTSAQVSLGEAAEENKDHAIPVLLDGLAVDFDAAPVIEKGRTLVPFRAIAEALQVKVAWQDDTREITAEGAGIKVRLQVDSETAYIDEAPVTLDVPPVIKNGRALVPLRFFSEAFDCEVAWLGHEKGVRLFSPPADMNVTGFYALGSEAASSWEDLFGEKYPLYGPGHTDMVDELALGWYSLDEEGTLLTRSRTGWQRPSGWERVLDAAGEFNLKTEMVVHEGDAEGTITSLLNDKEARQKAVKEIVAEAQLYDGVNLNLEGLGLSGTTDEIEEIKEGFTYFCQLLSQQLRNAGKSFTLTIHPPNSEYRGYDYRALGEVADRIIVMAHDYGHRPEPLNKVQEAVIMAKQKVPSHKLVLAVSIPSENVESLPEKVGIAKRYNLQGVSLWRLGLLSDEMWDTLRTVIKER